MGELDSHLYANIERTPYGPLFHVFDLDRDLTPFLEMYNQFLSQTLQITGNSLKNITTI